MQNKPPACELRARVHDPEDRFGVSFKVYSSGRLKGAILPIEEDDDGLRWESIALDGSTRRWRYRNAARDYLCELQPPEKPARPAETR